MDNNRLARMVLNHDIGWQIFNRSLSEGNNEREIAVEHLWLFAVLVFGIVVLPGADMAYVLANAVAGGTRAGFIAIAGIVTGGVAHVAASALGIGLLLQQFPNAFNALLIAGCMYVFWMGFVLLRGRAQSLELTTHGAAPSQQIFLRALVTCLLNPKAYAFMFAVFPQFLRADKGPIALQAVAMSAMIAINQIVVYGGVCLLAARTRHSVGQNVKAQTLFTRTVGGLLLLTAAWAVLSGWRVD
jgi:threonine/homoserine/homoserine lactone efflux protein